MDQFLFDIKLIIYNVNILILLMKDFYCRKKQRTNIMIILVLDLENNQTIFSLA